jgi:Ca2+-binding EF-hand superfamily protein
MTNYLLGAAAAAAAVAMSPAIAQTAPPAPHAQFQHAPMKAHTRADVGAHIRTMFTRLDSNRDGFITKAEVDSRKGERRAKRADRRGATGDRAAHRGAMFDRLDSNRDGQISRSEFEARSAQRQERRIAVRTHRDGAGAPGAMHGVHGKRMGGKGMGMGLRGHMFDMADGNRDGRVTLQEATAAAYRHFDMADANRDGQITPDERMQMRQRMRTERRPG